MVSRFRSLVSKKAGFSMLGTLIAIVIIVIIMLTIVKPRYDKYIQSPAKGPFY